MGSSSSPVNGTKPIFLTAERKGSDLIVRIYFVLGVSIQPNRPYEKPFVLF